MVHFPYPKPNQSYFLNFWVNPKPEPLPDEKKIKRIEASIIGNHTCVTHVNAPMPLVRFKRVKFPGKEEPSLMTIIRAAQTYPFFLITAKRAPFDDFAGKDFNILMWRTDEAKLIEGIKRKNKAANHPFLI